MEEEEEDDSVDKIATKPTPLETRQAIETLVNFSMFMENGEIGNMTMKVSALVEKDPIL